MGVVRWLEPAAVAASPGGPPTLASVSQALTSVFHADMVPMGVVFGALSGVLAWANGAYRHALGAQRDLLARQLETTQRYRAELQEALERVRAQNARLARLEQARRRTTRFMVHDFKTHLGCIIGFAELLMQAPENARVPEHGEAVSRIHRQGLRMMDAVTDLLDLERLQETVTLERCAVSPADLLREATDDVTVPVDRGRIELGPDHRACPPVLADRRLVVRVLSNLATNALKHNPPGTRAVLDAALQDEEGGLVLFSCRDDGKGIPVSLLESVFAEFHSGGRADGPASSSGLGLAFCKAAVEAHGGRIWCETAEGQGARFYFTVPRAEAPAATRLHGVDETLSRGASPAACGEGPRIEAASS
jgi:signal transduction histidine kinase